MFKGQTQQISLSCQSGCCGDPGLATKPKSLWWWPSDKTNLFSSQETSVFLEGTEDEGKMSGGLLKKQTHRLTKVVMFFCSFCQGLHRYSPTQHADILWCYLEPFLICNCLSCAVLSLWHSVVCAELTSLIYDLYGRKWCCTHTQYGRILFFNTDGTFHGNMWLRSWTPQLKDPEFKLKLNTAVDGQVAHLRSSMSQITVLTNTQGKCLRKCFVCAVSSSSHMAT